MSAVFKYVPNPFPRAAYVVIYVWGNCLWLQPLQLHPGGAFIARSNGRGAARLWSQQFPWQGYSPGRRQGITQRDPSVNVQYNPPPSKTLIFILALI